MVTVHRKIAFSVVAWASCPCMHGQDARATRPFNDNKICVNGYKYV